MFCNVFVFDLANCSIEDITFVLGKFFRVVAFPFFTYNSISEERLKQALEAESKIVELKTAMHRLWSCLLVVDLDCSM